MYYRVECLCGVTFQLDESERDGYGHYICGWPKCGSEPRKVERIDDAPAVEVEAEVEAPADDAVPLDRENWIPTIEVVEGKNHYTWRRRTA